MHLEAILRVPVPLLGLAVMACGSPGVDDADGQLAKQEGASGSEEPVLDIRYDGFSRICAFFSHVFDDTNAHREALLTLGASDEVAAVYVAAGVDFANACSSDDASNDPNRFVDRWFAVAEAYRYAMEDVAAAKNVSEEAADKLYWDEVRTQLDPPILPESFLDAP